MSTSTAAPPGGPGLTVAGLFDSLPDRELRRFLDSGVLSVLDAIFGGCIAGADLRRVTRTLVDFDVLLGERAGRRLVLDLIPERKRTELEARVGRTVASAGTSDWTESEVRRLRDFFGLVEERIVPPAVPPTSTITPAYSLFEHQRNAVRKLAPLLAQDERRAVLHLPTGVGKTRTAMHVVADSLRAHEPSVVVWLASGKELLEQAVLAFKEAWTHLGARPLRIGTMWGRPDAGSRPLLRRVSRRRAGKGLGRDFAHRSGLGSAAVPPSSAGRLRRSTPEHRQYLSADHRGAHAGLQVRVAGAHRDGRGELGPISTKTVSLPSSSPETR